MKEREKGRRRRGLLRLVWLQLLVPEGGGGGKTKDRSGLSVGSISREKRKEMGGKKGGRGTWLFLSSSLLASSSERGEKSIGEGGGERPGMASLFNFLRRLRHRRWNV